MDIYVQASCLLNYTQCKLQGLNIQQGKLIRQKSPDTRPKLRFPDAVFTETYYDMPWPFLHIYWQRIYRAEILNICRNA
jgi:hypothetical protein